jgi:DnaK suppressor protein
VKATAKTKAKPAAKAAAKAAKPAAKANAKSVKKPVKTAAKKPVASKPVAKKSAPKKAVVKKPVAKKAQTKKPVVKKPVAKKVPAKKPVAKKVAPQKALAKKPVAKKVPAKKPLAKKAAAPVKKAAAKPVVKSNPKPLHKAAPPPAPKVQPPVNVAPQPEARKFTGRAAKAAAGVPPPPSNVQFSNAAKASFGPAVEPRMPTLVPVIPKKDVKLANNWKKKPVEKLSDAEVLAMPDAEYMNDTQMAYFRLKLQQLKQDILNSAGETTEHLREDTVIVPDPADRATIEEEHALELRTRDRERKLLKKIEQSIQRIDMGDYGYCDETGEPIGVARLLARPTATLSLEAQQRRELKQKMFGD